MFMMLIKTLLLLMTISPVLQGVIRGSYRRSITSFNAHSFFRPKRSPQCGYWKNEFMCGDGTCITVERKCDGAVDCPDGTDETHYLCRDNRCPDYLFRCTYGGCVDRSALCNSVSDCADSSDEFHIKCRNDSNIIGSQFKCDDGSLIEQYLQCDGTIHCRDGSDENLMSCSSFTCPANYFQCAYGACIDESAECNNIKECVDGSDEHELLCGNRKTSSPMPIVESPQNENICKLPPHPENGMYLKNGASSTYNPGDEVDPVYLNVTCRPGYKVVGSKLIICYKGFWSTNVFPTCARACKIEESLSVSYRCLITEEGSEGTRECEDMEVESTVVVPSCKAPNYYSPVDLPYMYCVDGTWSHIPKCQPECGTLTPRGEALIAGGRVAERGEVPWHVGVYRKHGRSKHEQICGGSLISENIAISAAHCFWREGYGKLPERIFSLAVGKRYREWNHRYDNLLAQKSDVKRIIIAPRFKGLDMNYQSDLAIVIAKRPFEYRPHVRPLCVDFTRPFYENNMRRGDVGKVPGFGLTNDHKGSESPILKVVDMPFVPFEECISRTQREFVEFITNDKFCAGYGNGTTVCPGDSGGSWAYPVEMMDGRIRYYLGGIVSASPDSYDGSQCNMHALTSFTDVYKFSKIIKRYWIP